MVKCWDLGGPKDARSGPVRLNCAGTAGLMGIGLQVPSSGGYTTITDTSPNLARAVFFGPYTNNGTRMTYMEAWARPDVPSGTPYPVPMVIIPVPPTHWYPDYYWPDDPNEWPPLQPKPDDPKKPVWPDVTDSPEPTFPEHKVVGDGDPELFPDLPPKGDRRTRYRRDPKPHEPYTKDPKHDRRRPRKREKEKKFNPRTKFAKLAVRLLQLASGTYGGITEVVDMVAAIYAALPARLIAQDVNNLPPRDVLPHMLGMIWAHRHHIDMMEAMDNLAFNMIEDAAYGWYFQALGDIGTGNPNLSGYDREMNLLYQEFRESLTTAERKLETTFEDWIEWLETH